MTLCQISPEYHTFITTSYRFANYLGALGEFPGGVDFYLENFADESAGNSALSGLLTARHLAVGHSLILQFLFHGVKMRGFLVVFALAVLRVGNATPIRGAQHVLQAPLGEEIAVHNVATRKLHGRFLHITGKYSPQLNHQLNQYEAF